MARWHPRVAGDLHHHLGHLSPRRCFNPRPRAWRATLADTLTPVQWVFQSAAARVAGDSLFALRWEARGVPPGESVRFGYGIGLGIAPASMLPPLPAPPAPPAPLAPLAPVGAAD